MATPLPPGFTEELRRALPADALLCGAAAAAAADRDQSRHAPCAPHVVALPSSTEQVAAIVRACAAHRVPLTPRGAGSGVEGGAIPVAAGVVLDTSRLNAIHVLPERSLAVVGAGVRKLELAKALAPHGLVFGPDPSSNPSLGGMASTSASGMTTVRWGTTRENVISLVVVTPAGDIIRTRSQVRKSSTGLDLNQLYLGAEGTLGVICELTLRLFPMPQARTGMLLPFTNIDAAAAAVLALLRAAPPTLLRCELLNGEAVACSNKIFDAQLRPRPTLFVECAGATLADTHRDAASMLAIATRCGAELDAAAPSPLADGDALDDLWEVRRGCYPAAMRYRSVAAGTDSTATTRRAPDKVLITDVCVPLPALPDVIAATEADFESQGLLCVICAHIADGNFHCLVPYATAAEEAACHAAEERMIQRAIAAGGTVSGEHGVGMGKIQHCLCEHGAAHMEVQRRIKMALDPLGLINPGKLYHVPHHEHAAAPHAPLPSKM
jgi:D-lactate dehydrogenase (cytochrome)